MKNSLFPILLALVCTACSRKSPGPEEIPGPAGVRLEACRFYFTDKSAYRVLYTYNAEGLLEKEEQLKDNGEVLFATTYWYEGGRLVKEEIGADPKIASLVLRYRDDTLASLGYEEFREGPERQHLERTYTYPEKNRVRIEEQDLVRKTTEFIDLYLLNENIVRSKTLDPVTGRVKNEVIFEYDTHPNPHYGLTGKPSFFRFRTKNNLTVLRTLVENGMPGGAEVRYVYDYAENGLPLKKYQLLAGNTKLPEQDYLYEEPTR